MRRYPHFKAQLTFHFNEHGPGRRHWFIFSDDLHRRVPISMDGVEGLHTLMMWMDAPADRFRAGDNVEVHCRVIAPELFDEAAVPGATFELWDGGFFASGLVLERFDLAFR